MLLLVVCVISIASFSSAAKAPLDSFTTVCSKSDPNLNECVKKSAQRLVPYLAKGIRDYNFPPIDPLNIQFISLVQSESSVGLKINMSDTSHLGMTDMQITSAKMNMKTNHWEIGLHFPRYTIIGTCDLGGRILLLPIVGHGFCNLTSNVMDAVFKMDSKLVKGKNGVEHYKFSKFAIDITFHKGAFQLEGLFGGNKELGAAMNRFLNENILEVFNEMKSALEATFSEIFGGLVSRVFSAVPADNIFKP